MWVAYLRQGTITFGNDTNNRIESENSKLKHLMCASSSMSECIHQLCFHNAILDDERQYQQFLSKYKTVQYGNKDEDLSPLYSQFTFFYGVPLKRSTAAPRRARMPLSSSGCKKLIKRVKIEIKANKKYIKRT